MNQRLNHQHFQLGQLLLAVCGGHIYAMWWVEKISRGLKQWENAAKRVVNPMQCQIAMSAWETRLAFLRMQHVIKINNYVKLWVVKIWLKRRLSESVVKKLARTALESWTYMNELSRALIVTVSIFQLVLFILLTKIINTNNLKLMKSQFHYLEHKRVLMPDIALKQVKVNHLMSATTLKRPRSSVLMNKWLISIRLKMWLSMVLHSSKILKTYLL